MDVVLDFDGTITVQDTIGILAESALAIQKKKGNDLDAAWDRILEQYGEDYTVYKNKYIPAEPDRLSLADEVAFQRGLRTVDDASRHRVQASGLFAHIPAAELFREGQDVVRCGKVQLRPGFSEFVDQMARRGRRIHVVSVNWSASFIRGVLAPVEDVAVVANEVAGDETGQIRGPELDGETPVLATSGCKITVVDRIRALAEARQLVYFGDSLTDIECLTGYPGIVMSDDGEGKLLKALRRVGLDVAHISEAGPASRIAWARNFQEVLNHGFGERKPFHFD